MLMVVTTRLSVARCVETCRVVSLMSRLISAVACLAVRVLVLIDASLSLGCWRVADITDTAN